VTKILDDSRPRVASRPRVRAAVLAAAVGGSLLPLTAAAAATTAPSRPIAATPTIATTAHGTGLTPSTLRVTAANGLARARQIGAVRAAAASLPASVDLTPYAISPGDQRAVSSCVGWATGYTLLGWYANYQKHAGAPFAPMYVYSQINGGRDAGATIPSAWNILESQGVAEQAAYSQGNYNWADRPTTAETTNAAQHKTRSHAYLFSGDNQGGNAQIAIETALASNNPVVIGIPVHSGFGSLSPSNQVWRLSNTTGQNLLGYHALVAVGYDSTGIRIENSWGTGWGAAGFATLAWDFVNRYIFEASVGTGFVITNQNVAPKVTAVSRTAVSSRGGDTLTVTATGLSTVDTTATGAVRLVNVADPSVSVPLTVTGSTASTLTVTAGAAPTGTDGKPVTGAYRVVLTGSGGTSAVSDATAGVAVLTPYDVSVEQSASALTTGGSKITLTGAGFGSTATAFSGNGITATVNGKSAQVSWLSDTKVQVAVPADASSPVASIVLLRQGVPSVAVTVPYLPPAPVVSSVSPATVATTGGTVTVTATQLSTVSTGTTTVRLVNVANPAITGVGTIASRTGSALTVSLPAAPVDGNGAPVGGAYRVVVVGAGGSSTATGTADQVTYLTPYTISVAPGSVASAAGGTLLPVTGSGFGATSAAFTANKVTVTVGGRAATVTWVNDTRVTVTVPAGTPGAPVSVVLLRNGLASQPDTNAKYVAVITGSSQQAGPTAGGWTTSLTGVGFKAGSWSLVDNAGNTVATLPSVSTRDALNPAASGVFVQSTSAAVVKLPAAPAGQPGSYTLTFTPDRSAYPAASAAYTSKAVIIYSDLG
jgi:C1A family cysteine protease